MAYYHVVFTTPAEITDVAYQNKAVVYDILFKAASQALLTIAADSSLSRVRRASRLNGSPATDRRRGTGRSSCKD